MDQTLVLSIERSLRNVSLCDKRGSPGYMPGVAPFYSAGIIVQRGSVSDFKLPFMDNEASSFTQQSIKTEFFYNSALSTFHLYASLLGIKYDIGDFDNKDSMEESSIISIILERRSRAIDNEMFRYAVILSKLTLPMVNFGAMRFNESICNDDLVDIGLFDTDTLNISSSSDETEADGGINEDTNSTSSRDMSSSSDDHHLLESDIIRLQDISSKYSSTKGLVIYAPPTFGKTHVQLSYPFRWVDTDYIFNCSKKVVRTMLNLGFTVFTNMWQLIDPNMNVLMLIPPRASMANRFMSNLGIPASDANKWADDIITWSKSFREHSVLNTQYVECNRVATLYAPIRLTYLKRILKDVTLP